MTHNGGSSLICFKRSRALLASKDLMAKASGYSTPLIFVPEYLSMVVASASLGISRTGSTKASNDFAKSSTEEPTLYAASSWSNSSCDVYRSRARLACRCPTS